MNTVAPPRQAADGAEAADPKFVRWFAHPVAALALRTMVAVVPITAAAYPSYLDVTLANVAPVVNPDTSSVLEDAPTTNLDVLGNDVDTNVDAATVAITVPPTLGSAVAQADGSIDYTPPPDANGADSFSYQVCDTVGLCSSATASITLVPLNDAPSFGLSSSVSGLLPGPVSIAGCATTMATGPADESSQTLNFTVSLRDSGGSGNGGVDTSATQTFTIIVV